MALTKKQQEHPRFLAISAAVSEALVEVAARFDIREEDLESVSLPLRAIDKAVDEATSVLLKAWDVNHHA
jgi:hypothetical protein